MRYEYDTPPAYDDCEAAIQARSDRQDQDARERHAADVRAEQNGRDDLPEFRHQPASERAPTIRIHTAPAEPAQPPETRMSIAQLRDRISGMEATTRQKALPPVNAGTRQEGPCARNERAEKLTRYRAELARRETAERETKTAEPATLRANGQPARVDPADVPALVQCGLCKLLIGQDNAGDMLPHLDNEQDPCSAAPTYWLRPRPKRETPTQPADRAAVEFARAAEHAAELEARRSETAAQAEASLQIQRDAIAADAAESAGATARRLLHTLSVPCRECNAAPQIPCQNYTGAPCAPHGVRKADAAHVVVPDPTPTPAQATATEIPPVPPAAAAAIRAASDKRRLTVATARADTLTELDAAVEKLVREHSSGAVIDAAWAAGKRLFNPQAVRA